MNARPLLPVLVMAAALLLSACAGQSGATGAPVPGSYARSNVESGRRLMASYGCGSCHSIPGVPGAYAMAGPPLDRFYERTYIAGRFANTPENLVTWIMDPQKVWPGNAMPNLGVTAAQARDMAAYLESPPGSPVDWFSR